MDVLTVDDVTYLDGIEAERNVTATHTTAECVQSIVQESYMIAVYLIIGLLGFLSNVFVLIVFALHRPIRKHLTNAFVVNMSAIDATVSAMLFLTTVYQNDSRPLTIGYWPDELLCRVWFTKLPLWGMLISSTYGILALTFERYTGIVHPLWHKTKFSKMKVILVLVATWIVGPAYNCAYQTPTSEIKAECNYTCTVYTAWPSHGAQKVVGVLTVVLEYFIPLAFLIYFYVRMTSALRRIDMSSSDGASVASVNAPHSYVVAAQQRARRRARRNVFKILTTVGASYVICWTPNQVNYFLFNSGIEADTDINSSFHSFTIILVLVNSCVNPMIYCMRYEQFQKGVQSICRRLKSRPVHTKPAIAASSDELNNSSSNAV